MHVFVCTTIHNPGGRPATLAGSCSTKNSTTPLGLSLRFSPLGTSAKQANKQQTLLLITWGLRGSSNFGWLADGQHDSLRPGCPHHWTRLLSRSQFEGSCPQDYYILTYVTYIFINQTILNYIITYSIILNYIIVRHWFLLALVNSYLPFSAILRKSVSSSSGVFRISCARANSTASPGT